MQPQPAPWLVKLARENRVLLDMGGGVTFDPQTGRYCRPHSEAPEGKSQPATASPWAVADKAPQSLPEPLSAAAWEGKPVPCRQWLVEGLVPNRTVTLLSGDGGVGKSLFALQLGVAMALGAETVGLAPVPGRCLYLGAEDEEDEFHRRASDVARHLGGRLADLRDFYLVPMADRDALLAVPDKGGRLAATPLWLDFVARAAEIAPHLIVLDTSADLFGGDEIKRAQVRTFVGMLRGLAMDLDCAVLLLSHPSLTGINTGSGLSGSTAWNNSVRSRLYMEHVKDGNRETGAISLRTKKSNYGPRDGEVTMCWQDGAFVPDTGAPGPAQALLDKRSDEMFVALLSKLNRQGHRLSSYQSPTYAPKVMAAQPDAKGFTKKGLADAMQRLLDAGTIQIVEEGPPSRRYRRLLVASEMCG